MQALDEVPAATVPATFLFNRGQPDQPKDAVKPGDLTVLAGLRKVEVPEKNAALPTSGRRLAFAQSLTDGRHPLIARVLVNRVWMPSLRKRDRAQRGRLRKARPGADASGTARLAHQRVRRAGLEHEKTPPTHHDQRGLPPVIAARRHEGED